MAAARVSAVEVASGHVSSNKMTRESDRSAPGAMSSAWRLAGVVVDANSEPQVEAQPQQSPPPFLSPTESAGSGVG